MAMTSSPYPFPQTVMIPPRRPVEIGKSQLNSGFVSMEDAKLQQNDEN